MKRLLVALLLTACSGSAVEVTEPPPWESVDIPDARRVPAELCVIAYSIQCGKYRFGTYARCYGDKAGYAITDGTKFECTIGDNVGCREALTAARDHCAALTLSS